MGVATPATPPHTLHPIPEVDETQSAGYVSKLREYDGKRMDDQ